MDTEDKSVSEISEISELKIRNLKELSNDDSFRTQLLEQ